MAGDAQISAALSHLLWQTQHLVEQALDAALAPLGLSTTLVGTLGFVVRQPGISTADLARLARVRPQSAAYAVTRLERAGLLERTPHPVHGRVMRLHATDEGRRLLLRAEAVADETERELTEAIPAAARSAFAEHLDAVRAKAERLLDRGK